MRLLEIANEIEARGTEITAEEITAFNTEVDALKEERTTLLTANTQRQTLLESIAEGRAGTPGVPILPTPHPQSGEQRTGDVLSASIDYRNAFMNYVLRGTKIPDELRAHQTTMTTDVGSVIPQPVLNKIIEKMEAVGMILPLVTRTSYQGGLNVPTSSAKPVATWVAEGAGSNKQKKPTGVISFKYHKLRCAVAVSLEVDTMALSAFESSLINNVVRAMVKATEQSMIDGDGIGKPTGILAETPIAEQVIKTAQPTYEDLLKAEAALPIEYESDAVWCMSKKTFMTFQAMVDATGQPIARTNHGISGKIERVLLGRPVVLCNYVASFTSSLATGTPFAFIFNFEDYILNTNYNMGIKRYEDNENDDKVTRAVMLTDGKVVDKNSLVIMKKQ